MVRRIHILYTVLLIFTLNITIAQSWVFSLEDIPHKESATTIIERDLALAESYANFFDTLEYAITTNTIESWLNEKVDLRRYLNHTVLYEETNFLMKMYFFSNEYEKPEIKSEIISYSKQYLDDAYRILNEQIDLDLQNGRPGYLYDLNTVQPAAAFFSLCYILKQEGLFTDSLDNLARSVISDYIEYKSHFYKGGYQSTGYNKEVYALSVSFWIQMLYPAHPTEFPYTVASFNSFWNGILSRSYDADNSPHYDAGTGFKLILEMGILLGREDQLEASPHVKRIMDRMARCVSNSGQTAIWGKFMWGFQDRESLELYTDAGASLIWCLKMGYRLYNNPYYLYVARKYEAIRKLNLGKRSNKKYMLKREFFFWPHLPKYKNQTKEYSVFPFTEELSPTNINEKITQTTERITSSIHYGANEYPDGGSILGRGDVNYHTVQDKIILGTGHHPNAPFILSDMSFSGHKASIDHRMGIDNFIFKGTHVTTRSNRMGEANKGNTVFICPQKGAVSKQKINYPIINAESKHVVPSLQYLEEMNYEGNNSLKVYDIENFSTDDLNSEIASYGRLKHTKYQYEGVSVERQLVLLHNGIVAVLDEIEMSEEIDSSYLAGVVYQIWPFVDSKSQDSNWVIQPKHKKITIDGSDNNSEDEFKTLYYFPDLDNGKCGIKKDTNHTNVNTTFSKHKLLSSGDKLEVLSFIIPLKEDTNIENFISQFEIEKTSDCHSVKIPYTEDSKISLKFYSSDQSADIWINNTIISNTNSNFFSKEDGLIAYPTPSNNTVFFKGLSNQLTEFELYDMVGNKLRDSIFLNAKNNSINISTLETGLYRLIDTNYEYSFSIVRQ